MVEDTEIALTQELVSAFLIMFCSYYIFKLAYPIKLNGTLSYFQKCIAKIDDSRRMKQNVLTFAAKI